MKRENQTMKRALMVLAWVAWTHSTFPAKDLEEWTPGGAAETLEECRQATVVAATDSLRQLRAQSNRGTVFTQAGAGIEMKFASGDTATLVYVCLPENIDPRGPKGK